MMPPRALRSRLVMEGITVAQIAAILAKLVRTAVRVALLLVPNLALAIHVIAVAVQVRAGDTAQ
ncbi:hypothetical protein PTI98_013301 [Pleurotus ostreatus]|nr:hypothetical protein PTI98_013301 [Pleurotus ostreatus]